MWQEELFNDPDRNRRSTGVGALVDAWRSVDTAAMPLKAADLMTEHPATLHMRETLGDALQRFAALDVRHLPVVDETYRLLGMVSERDVLGALGPEGTPHDVIDRVFQRTVDSLMTPNVIAAEPDTPVVDLIDTMIAKKVGALPIIDDLRVVVGIVSYIDVLRALRPLVTEGA